MSGDAAARVRFGDDGLVPAIVQDADTGRVLTLAWMNADSLARTLERGETWFWSRSRGELWHKGATSGNTQQVTGLATDCDDDAVLVSVRPAGPACLEPQADPRPFKSGPPSLGPCLRRHLQHPWGTHWCDEA